MPALWCATSSHITQFSMFRSHHGRKICALSIRRYKFGFAHHSRFYLIDDWMYGHGLIDIAFVFATLDSIRATFLNVCTDGSPWAHYVHCCCHLIRQPAAAGALGFPGQCRLKWIQVVGCKVSRLVATPISCHAFPLVSRIENAW